MMHQAISSQAELKYRLLYVGADLALLEFVQEALKGDGWFVVRCSGGSVAEVLLRSAIRYDLLMFDEELAGGSGRELVRLARSLEHRRLTPVILLSQKEGAAQGRQAGVRLFVGGAGRFEAVVEAIRAQSSRSRGAKLEP